jgi:endopolyphosphatase
MEADDLELYTDTTLSGNKGLYEGIIDNFESLPKTKKKFNLDNYGVITVSPSVVPNPYLPTFRIFTYNITGANSAMAHATMPPSDKRVRMLKDRVPKHPRGGGKKAGDKKKLCKEKEHKDSWKCKLHEPWHSDDEAPSRRNTLWSPLGYAQVRAFYFLLLHGMLCATRLLCG